MWAWIEANAAGLMIVGLALLVVWSRIELYIMSVRCRNERRELMDRHMSRDFGEYALGRVAMGESGNDDGKSADAISQVGDMLDNEEMAYNASGPYRDKDGHEVVPITS